MKYLSPEECKIIKVWFNELEDYNLLIGNDSDETIFIRDKCKHSVKSVLFS